MSWIISELGKICDIVAGQSPPSETYNKIQQGMPFFQGKTDFGELYPTVRTWCSKPNKIAEPDDILISVRAPVGATNICNIVACIGRGLAAIKPSKYIDQKYLLYYFRHFEPILSESGNGAIFSAITMSDLKSVKIPLPPLDVQKKIAAVLEKADELRRKREAQIKKLDELLQATFLDMFGDPVTNPKKWDLIKLGSLSHKITDGVHAKPTYTSTGKPFISVVNITSGQIKFENCKFVSEGDFTAFTRSNKPDYGDILYTKVGATYGIPAFVDVDKDFCLYVSVCLIKPNHDLINSRFLAVSMAMPYIKRQADNRIKGIGVPDLHLNQIKEFDICCPPRQMQDEFVKFFLKLDREKEILRKQLAEQHNLFNSLMQRAFRGDLDLK